MDPNATTRLDNDPFIGRTFDGYRIDGVVGRGGMGVVYLATQLSLARPVAIKVLPAEVADNPQFLDRFHREVDVLSRLSHPNIVTVMERGEIDGRPYVVMEYVDGANLRAVVKDGPLAATEALTIVRAVLSALEHAHDKGIIHRDIKPENVLVAKGGIVKVADFGLGRLLGPADMTRLTHTHVALGTYEYMAPEQREKAREADERSDLYAAGVVLYEMLTGELPIGRFDLPSERRPGECDQRIDRVIERSLDKTPERRYQRASEMGAAVSQLLSSPVVAAPAPPPPAPAAPAHPRVPRPEWHFAIALTALWVSIVIAANGFDMRDEEWMWLVVGAFVSVWVILRRQRIFSFVKTYAKRVTAILILAILGSSAVWYMTVGGNWTPHAERGASRPKTTTHELGTAHVDHLPKMRELLAADDSRRWVQRAMWHATENFPRGLRLFHDQGRVHLEVERRHHEYPVSVALAVGVLIDRVFPEDFERTLRMNAVQEASLARLPPPGEDSVTVRVGTFHGKRPGVYYPSYLNDFPAAVELQLWVKEHFRDVAGIYPAGVSLEYDRGNLWVRLDANKYPAWLQGQLVASLAVAVKRAYPEKTKRVFTTDASFERLLKRSPPPRILPKAEE